MCLCWAGSRGNKPANQRWQAGRHYFRKDLNIRKGMTCLSNSLHIFQYLKCSFRTALKPA